MKSKTMLALALAALLCVMTFTAFHVPAAKARSIPMLDLSPNQPIVIYGDSLAKVTLGDPNAPAKKGDTDTISFRVHVPAALGTLDLFAWQTTFTWDVADLSCTHIAWGTEPTTMVWPANITDGVHGTVMYGGACGDRTQKVQVSSSGIDLILFTVKFEVTSDPPPTTIYIFPIPPLIELFGLSDDGNGWPINGIPEFTTYAVWPDINNDGVINIYDAILFANHWGAYNKACDFDNDGYVDIFDLAILNADLGKTNTGQHWGDTNTLYGITHTLSVGVGYPGDLNGDGTVDIYDAIILSGAYNSQPGYGNWNPSADINKDGIVDIYDAIILSSYYVQPKT